MSNTHDTIVVRYACTRRILDRPLSYDEAKDMVKDHFPEINLEHFACKPSAKLIDGNGAFVPIRERDWGAVGDKTKILLVEPTTREKKEEIVVAKPVVCQTKNSPQKMRLSPKKTKYASSPKKAYNLDFSVVVILAGTKKTYTVNKRTTIEQVANVVARSYGYQPNQLQFQRHEKPVSFGDTVGGLGMVEGSKLYGTTLEVIEKVKISLETAGGDTFLYTLNTNTPLIRLVDVYSKKVGKCADSFRFIYDGRRFALNETPKSLGMQDGDYILCDLEQKGGKPVIYLFPPEEIDAIVRLSLAPQWRFDAVYPVVPIKNSSKDVGCTQEIQWSVLGTPGGTMTDKSTGLDVTYLFWEALTHPISRRSKEQFSIDTFSPTQSICRPSDSVLLPVGKVPAYLDKALLALGLHTEARTSFITYWLPSIQKHELIALRFVPQGAYEKSAPLTVSPAPDVVTRVFMLFQGVKSTARDTWREAEERASFGASIWKDVVGVDSVKQKDTRLFRVLEWGGMEVLVI